MIIAVWMRVCILLCVCSISTLPIPVITYERGIGVDLCRQPTCGQLESYGDVADLCGQLHQRTLESVVLLEISGVGDLCGHLHQRTLESAVFLEISRDMISTVSIFLFV